MSMGAVKKYGHKAIYDGKNGVLSLHFFIPLLILSACGHHQVCTAASLFTPLYSSRSNAGHTPLDSCVFRLCLLKQVYITVRLLATI